MWDYDEFSVTVKNEDVGLGPGFLLRIEKRLHIFRFQLIWRGEIFVGIRKRL